MKHKPTKKHHANPEKSSNRYGVKYTLCGNVDKHNDKVAKEDEEVTCTHCVAMKNGTFKK